MARNAIESEFRTSKMADGSHFIKNFQKTRIHIHHLATSKFRRVCLQNIQYGYKRQKSGIPYEISGPFQRRISCIKIEYVSTFNTHNSDISLSISAISH